jgi:hypothetical protein
MVERLIRFCGLCRRTELESAIAGRLRAEDDNRVLYARVESLAAELKEAQIARVADRGRIADWVAKRSGLGTIFEALESIPDPPRPAMQPAQSGRMHAAYAVADAEAEFENEYAEMLKSYGASGQ